MGRRLVERLDAHDVVGIDTVADGVPQQSHVETVCGDLCDPAVLEHAFAGGCDAVIHLATVPGGAAEQNPELARRVNVEATMALARQASLAGNVPRFVFASSIAVFGDPLPDNVDDSTPLAPKMYYGAHKAMMEEWLATMTRRGELSGVSLRLSGVVARPSGPSGMKFAFMSDVFHAMQAGKNFVLPVSENATSWLTSVECAAQNFVHSLVTQADPTQRVYALTLPAIRVRMADLVNEIARQTGYDLDRIDYQPDAALEAAFGNQPPLSTRTADALGYSSDGSLEALVGRALAEN